MAYDGTITINTKIDTKEAEATLKRFNGFLSDKFRLDKVIVDNGAKDMGMAVSAAFDSINTSLKNTIGYSSGFSDFMKQITSATNLASGAKAAWNTAIAQNPIGTFLTGVSAANTALTLLVNGTGLAVDLISDFIAKKEEQDETLQNRAAADAAIQAIKEETAAYEERRRAQQEGIQGDLSQLGHVESLAQELERLGGATGQVKEADRGHAQFILNELNSALGTELTMTDGQIQGYQDLQAEIAKAVEAKRAEIMLSAQEGAYKEAIENRSKAYQDAATQKIACDQAQMAVDEQRSHYASELAFMESYASMSQADQALYAERYSNDLISTWYLEVQEREKTLARAQQAYDDSKGVVQQYNDDIKTYETARSEFLAGNAQACEEILTQQSFAYQDAALAQGATDEERRQQLAQNYAVQLAAMEEYQANCAAGTDTFNEATYRQMKEHAAQLRTQGEEAGVCYGEGHLEGLDGQTIVLTDAMREIDAQVQKEQEEQRKLAEKSNSDTIDSFNEKIQEQIENFQAQSEEKMNTATNDMVQNARDSTETAVEEADFPAMTEKVPTQMGDAIAENTGQMTDAAGGAVDDTAEAADKAVQKAGFEAVGSSIVQAIIDGLTSSMPLLAQAVQMGVQAAIAEGRDTLNGGAGGGKSSGVSGQGTAAGTPSAAASAGAGPATGGRFSALALPTGRAAAFVTQTQSGMAALQAQAGPGAPRAAAPVINVQAPPAKPGEGGVTIKQMVCSINAKDVKEFNDIVKVAQRAAMSYRMGYVDH